MGSNPLVTHPEAEKVLWALKKVDFTVVVDIFMTPTAQQADIVLPAASWLETDDVADLHFFWCYTVRRKVAQIEECRDDKEILIELAKRLGIADDFPWKDVKEYLNWVLKGAGVNFDQFKEIGVLKGDMTYKKYEQIGFNTPSKKFEFYSFQLKLLGFDPMPHAGLPPDYLDPQLTKEYPLILITGLRTEPFFTSEGRQIASLRKLNPYPTVEIHPTTAEKSGIENGDWVWIETRRGKIMQKARLTDRIHPKVVGAQYGWWYPEKPPPEYGFRESNVNVLLGGGSYDPHTGGENLRGVLCKVYRHE